MEYKILPKIDPKQQIWASEVVIKKTEDTSHTYQTERNPSINRTIMMSVQSNFSLPVAHLDPVVLPFESSKDDTMDVQENRPVTPPPTLPKNALFPLRLHAMLDVVERNGDDHIVSWLSDEKVRQKSLLCCKSRTYLGHPTHGRLPFRLPHCSRSRSTTLTSSSKRFFHSSSNRPSTSRFSDNSTCGGL